MKTQLLSLAFCLLMTGILTAQVGINEDGSNPDASAILDVKSTTKGMLIPRMTTAQRTIISTPAAGLLVYDMDSGSFWFYNGGIWTELITSPDDADADPGNELISSASLTGNTLNIVDAGGSTDVDLSDLVDDSDWVVNATDMYSSVSGNVGIGINTPNEKLDIDGNLLIRDAQNNGALIISPSGSGYGIDPELFIQAAESGGGNNASFHISRNAYFTTGTDEYLSIDDAHPSSKIEFQPNGNIHFGTAPASPGSLTFSDIMTVATDGNVGIGEIAPAEKLHVAGSIRMVDGDETIGYVATSDANGTMSWADPDTLTEHLFLEDTDTDTRIQVEESPDEDFIRFDVNGTEAMVLDNIGRLNVNQPTVIGTIGLGAESTDQGTSSAAGLGFTTTPWLYTNAIEAQGERGTNSTLITVGADGTYGSNDEIHFITNGSQRMSIESSGDVGIGNTTPEAHLHVVETSSVPVAAVIIEADFGPTNAYLGVQGDDDYHGITTLDISGDEIGLLGVSTGSSATDNVGVFGHSNGQGGRFEHTDGTAVLETVHIATSSEAMRTEGANGSTNVEIGENNNNTGRVSLYNATSDEKAVMFVDVNTDVGALLTSGPNSTNFVIGNLTGNTDNGFAAARDASGTNQAGVYVNASGDGIVFGDTKNFRMDHPVDPTKEIWYASIEGPEAAAYVRGTASLENGQAIITFPDHFSLVANETTITITLTPRSFDSRGLAFQKRGADKFEVRELNGGTGNYEFDWVAMAVRKGYEDYEPVREKRVLMELKPALNKQNR